jgi:transcription elongation factor Elf1
MPSSVAKNKQRYAEMDRDSLHKAIGHKSEDELRQLAWRHGYGKMSDHYVKRLKESEQISEANAYECATCGERAEPEEIRKDKGGNPNKTCSNCGDSDWQVEESEQLDEAKRPAHWHSEKLDGIVDMINSVGHVPHPTKFMANPSDADLADHYSKESEKHGKLADLCDTACFHAEQCGREHSCDKHKSMAEINIMKSDLYKTLAGLYQKSHEEK